MKPINLLAAALAALTAILIKTGVNSTLAAFSAIAAAGLIVISEIKASRDND